MFMCFNSTQCHSLFKGNFTDPLCSLKPCPQRAQNVPVILIQLGYTFVCKSGWRASFHVWYCKRMCITFSNAFGFEVLIWLSSCGVESNECFQFCSELLQSEMAFVSFLASRSVSDCGFELKDGYNIAIPLSPHIPPQVLTVEYSELAKRCTWKNCFVLNKCALRHTNAIFIPIG